MSFRDREGLIARLRQVRPAAAAPDPAPGGDRSSRDPLGSLEARVAHLEQLVEGLQDSVHRETERLSKRITELEAQLEPAALSAALSEHARNRGL